MVTDQVMLVDEAHTLRFQQLLERMKNEHGVLKKDLDRVREQTSHLVAMLGSEESKKLLHEIRTQMESLLQQLAVHEHWEEDEVLPVLTGYASQEIEPTFLTSTWVLEDDYKQAERFIRSFLDFADPCEPANCNKQKKALSLLCMACSVLEEHLIIEEEMVFPVADQLLREG